MYIMNCKYAISYSLVGLARDDMVQICMNTSLRFERQDRHKKVAEDKHS